MKRFILVLSFIGLHFFCVAQLPEKAKLDSLLDFLYRENKTMASVAFHKAGKPVYQHSTGIAGYQGEIPVFSTPGTRYRVGSVSKMFTTVIAFQLIEENLLALDDKLSKFFPSIQNAEKITIANMLNHHSGIHNITDDSSYLGYYTQPKTRAEMLQLIGSTKPDFEPGADVAYSNSNFILLTFILEDITKKSFSKLVKERITSKIKLKDTYVGTAIKLKDNEAQSFQFNNNKWEAEPETDMSIPLGAGAIESTASDVNLFLSALFAGRLINTDHLKMMQTMKDGYGMGMFEFPFYNKKCYGHTGGIDAFQSMYVYFPEDSVSFSILSNGNSYPMNNVVLGLMSLYYNKPYTFPVFKKYEGTKSDPKKYEGNYSSAFAPVKIRIFVEEGTLKAQATGQGSFPLTQTDVDEFSFEPAQIKIKFNPEKSTFIINQGGLDTEFKKE